jgi:hypothetical protein
MITDDMKQCSPAPTPDDMIRDAVELAGKLMINRDKISHLLIENVNIERNVMDLLIKARSATFLDVKWEDLLNIYKNS